MTNTPTFQMLDLQINGNKLIYRAWDTEGVMKDRFVIEK